MAEIKIDLNSEDINKAIADGITKSVLGEAIVKSVNEHIKNLITRSYDNPIDKLVMEEIKEYIKNLVQNKYKNEISQAIETRISGDFSERVIQLSLEKFLKSVY